MVRSAQEDFELRRVLHRASRPPVPAMWFGAFCIGRGTVTGVQAGPQEGAGSGIATWLSCSRIGDCWMTIDLVPFAFSRRRARVVGKHELSLDEARLHACAGAVTVDLPR